MAKWLLAVSIAGLLGLAIGTAQVVKDLQHRVTALEQGDEHGR